jgi:hypothetical protein
LLHSRREALDVQRAHARGERNELPSPPNPVLTEPQHADASRPGCGIGRGAWKDRDGLTGLGETDDRLGKRHSR